MESPPIQMERACNNRPPRKEKGPPRICNTMSRSRLHEGRTPCPAPHPHGSASPFSALGCHHSYAGLTNLRAGQERLPFQASRRGQSLCCLLCSLDSAGRGTALDLHKPAEPKETRLCPTAGEHQPHQGGHACLRATCMPGYNFNSSTIEALAD